MITQKTMKSADFKPSLTAKTTKQICNTYCRYRTNDAREDMKNDNIVWLCRDDVIDYLNCVFTDLKYLNEDDDYKKGYNHAVEDIFYQLKRVSLCNSQEQKQGVRGVAIVTPLSDASSVSCEHNTGEDVDSSEKTKKFSETTISGSADSKASPVQNPDSTKEFRTDIQELNPLGRGKELKNLSSVIPKKCTCKKPILYSAKFMNGICGRCGGEL